MHIDIYGLICYNNSKVPSTCHFSYLKVHLAGGKNAVFATRVKVSGKVSFPLVDQDFDCGLENPMVEAAG